MADFSTATEPGCLSYGSSQYLFISDLNLYSYIFILFTNKVGNTTHGIKCKQRRTLRYYLITIKKGVTDKRNVVNNILFKLIKRCYPKESRICSTLYLSFIFLAFAILRQRNQRTSPNIV